MSSVELNVADESNPLSDKGKVIEERQQSGVVGLLAAHKHKVELTVYYHARSGHSNSIVEVDGRDGDGVDDIRGGDDKCCISVLDTTTLDEVLQLVLKERGGDNGSASRLRRYNYISNRVGETYGGREGIALKELDFGLGAVLLLEQRTENDAPFVEFNPREMQLRMLMWNLAASQEASSANAQISQIFQTVPVVVPGEDQARVGDLRAEAAKALGVDANQIVLIAHSERVLVMLNDNEKILKKDFDVWPGDEIVVEVVAGGVTDCDSYESPAMTFLRSRRQSVRLFFNRPATSEEDGQSGIYTIPLDTSLDRALQDIKSNIATALAMSPDRFHLKRNANAPQLKDMSKTLLDLGIVDQSVLHVELGPGCVLGEHMVRFEVDAGDAAPPSGGGGGIAGANNDFIALGELPVKEKSTVLQLKEQILQNWSTLAAEAAASGTQDVPPIPASADHIRLRDGKNIQASGPLRNDRILSRCLLGLTDGRRIVIQVLPEPEIIAADDVVLSVRLAAYEAKSLGKPIDVPLPRSTTVQTLYEVLLAKFPQLNEEPPVFNSNDTVAENGGDDDGAQAAAAGGGGADEAVEVEPPTAPPAPSRVLAIAKGLTSGPPLTLKSTLKLKFNDSAVLQRANAPIDRPPLNLRDGSVIIVRGIADFERAREAVRLKKEAEGPRPASAGTGAAAAKAKRPASRGRFPSALPKDKGVKAGGDANGETPPPPTGDRNGADLPTVP